MFWLVNDYSLFVYIEHKLVVAQLVHKLQGFYGIWGFVTVFTTSWRLSWTKALQSIHCIIFFSSVSWRNNTKIKTLKFVDITKKRLTLSVEEHAPISATQIRSKDSQVKTQPVLWIFTLFKATPSPRRLWPNSVLIHVKFVVDEVEMGHFFLYFRIFLFSPVFIIPPTHHAHSFI